MNHSISNPLPAFGLTTVTADDDVVQLIKQDFPDEEDDDEYNPDDDDDQSDDYSTATCSDIESQPRTPGEALVCTDAEDSPTKSAGGVQYDEEGLFKLPSGLKTPNRPVADESATSVAKRTRSKVSLESTPIETIQETFIPPDLLPELVDGQDNEFDADEPWEEFLVQFQKPLGESFSWYIIKRFSIDAISPVAKEEEEDENDPEYVSKKERAGGDNEKLQVSKKEVQTLLAELFEDNYTPDLPDELEIEALHANMANISTTSLMEVNETENPNVSVKQWNASPSGATTENVLCHTTEESGFQQEVSVQEPATDQYIVTTYDEPMTIIDSTSSNVNMVLGTDNQLYLVGGDLSAEYYPVEDTQVCLETEELPEDTEIDGWTRKSLRVFHKQLLIHIQVAGQLFIQTYSNPLFWKCATPYKELLADLERLAAKQPFLRELAWNLSDMLEICEKWEAELKVESEENTEYVRELMPWSHRSSQYKRFVHHRVAELCVTHRAFIFADYLPRSIPGCFADCKRTRICRGEMILLVMSFIETRHKYKLTCGRGYIIRAAQYFQERYNPNKPIKYLTLCWQNQTSSGFPNPIQAYNKRKELPSLKVEELDIEKYEDVVPHAQKPAHTLQRVWNLYIFGRERAARLNPDANIVIPKKTPKPIFIPKDFDESVAEEEDLNDSSAADKTTVDAPVEEAIETPPKLETLVDAPVKPKVVTKKSQRSKSNLVDRRDEIEALKRLIERVRKRESAKSNRVSSVPLRKVVTNELNKFLRRVDVDYERNVNLQNAHSISTKIFHYFKEFDTFAQLLSVRLKSGKRIERQLETETGNRNRFGNNSMFRGAGLESNDSMFAWRFISQVEHTYRVKRLRCEFEKFLKRLKTLQIILLGIGEFFMVS